jgi:adenylate kinase
MAVNITAPDDVLVERMINRAKESSRSDDTPEAIRTRLEVQKPPADLLGHYRSAGKLKDVDGTPDVETVTASITAALGSGAGAVR